MDGDGLLGTYNFFLCTDRKKGGFVRDLEGHTEVDYIGF